jgi:hypothetical protein
MSIKELDDIAQWLYDNRVDEWSEFTDEELLKLANLCQITKENPFGRSYDDEVFDEIERRKI